MGLDCPSAFDTDCTTPDCRGVVVKSDRVSTRSGTKGFNVKPNICIVAYVCFFYMLSSLIEGGGISERVKLVIDTW